MWKCPICNRSFSRKNQSHSCELFSIEKHHLKKADNNTKKIFEKFIETVKSFGPIEIEPLKNIIALKKISQFCSITVQKKALKILFRNYTQFSNIRFNHTSKQKNMYFYEFYLRKMEDLDSEVENWMRTAYEEN
ncbi:MAG: hypothetical protein GY870_20680 [archaeon]|nr:hypothetical protein [archaeon]